MSNNRTYLSKFCFLNETPAVLSLVKLCEDPGFSYHCKSGQKPHLTKMASELIAMYQTMCHSLSLVYQRVPLQRPHLLLHHLHHRILCLTSADTPKIQELWGNLQHESTETENLYKNEGLEKVQSDISHEFPDWLQGFREKLVDESSPSEPRRNPASKDRDTSSSSHELAMESRAKVEPDSGKHSVHTHFPKDPNCDICLKTKITRASCRRRAGTVVLKAEKFGDLITVRGVT